MLKEMPVPARYYFRMAELLATEDWDTKGLLEQLQLTEKRAHDTDATVDFSRVDQILQQLAGAGMRTDLAFDIGKNITASAHSFVGFGMLNSATIHEALQFEARYFRLVMPSFSMRYRCDADTAELLFLPRVAMSRACLNFHLEAIGTAALREVQDLNGGQRPPCRLEYSFPEPKHHPRYSQEMRNVSVLFGVQSTPGVRLVVLENLSAKKLSIADKHARSVAEERCRALVKRAARKGNFADWVSMTLREVSDELPSLDEMAANISISKRSLNRYLAKEGTTYRKIAGQMQHEIACERLTAGGMSATEVAYSLGFSDPSNFSKAFRAKAGCSPGAYRQLKA